MDITATVLSGMPARRSANEGNRLTTKVCARWEWQSAEQNAGVTHEPTLRLMSAAISFAFALVPFLIT